VRLKEQFEYRPDGMLLRISIPFGAIKRFLFFAYAKNKYIFQFLLVRLKATIKNQIKRI